MDGRRWGFTDPTELCRHVRELRSHGGSSAGRHWKNMKKGDSSDACVQKLPLETPGEWGVKGRAGQSVARQDREVTPHGSRHEPLVVLKHSHTIIPRASH